MDEQTAEPPQPQSRSRRRARRRADPLRKQVRPDYRFSLANERTFLAWARTGLALVAGGIAVEQFASLKLSWITVVVGLFGICLGATVTVLGYRHYLRVQDAMEHERPLPGHSAIPLLVLGVVAIAVLLLAGILDR